MRQTEKITGRDFRLALEGANLLEDDKLKVEARARVVTIYAFYLLRQALREQFFSSKSFIFMEKMT